MATFALLGHLEGADEATARLILQLELNDIEQLQNSARAKYVAGSDRDVALQLQKDELQRTLQTLQDREIALRQDPGGIHTAQALQNHHHPTRRPHDVPLPTPAEITATQQGSPVCHETEVLQIQTKEEQPTISACEVSSTAKSPITVSHTVVASQTSNWASATAASSPDGVSTVTFKVTAPTAILQQPRNFFNSFCDQRVSSFSPSSARGTADPLRSLERSSATITTEPCSAVATDIEDALAIMSSAGWQGESLKDLSNQSYVFENYNGEELAEDNDWLYEDESDVGEVVAESASSATTRKPRKRRKRVPRRFCVACQEYVVAHYVAQVPCGDEYCGECLQELFSASLVDESLFPPRCCRQPIDPEHIEKFLTPELIEAHEEKKVEVQTVDRTYCSDPRCSIFLRSENISGDYATCPKCKKETCVLCKAPAHEGDCPADEITQEVLRLARENGWQRCTTCRRMIGISMGCNHIRCICQAAWCYVCAKKWKTCSCPQWDEQLLYDRANEVVDRELNQPGVARVAAVQAVVANLREHCDHPGWRFSHGARRCENCNDHMPVFTMHCEKCPAQFCRRCTRNRL